MKLGRVLRPPQFDELIFNPRWWLPTPIVPRLLADQLHAFLAGRGYRISQLGPYSKVELVYVPDAIRLLGIATAADAEDITFAYAARAMSEMPEERDELEVDHLAFEAICGAYDRLLKPV